MDPPVVNQLCEIIENQNYNREPICLMTEDRRKFIIKQIEDFTLNFLESLVFNGKLLSIKYRRLDWNNVDLNNNVISFNSDSNNKKVKESCVKHKNNCSSYSNFMLSVSILYESLKNYEVKTKRQIYYENSKNFQNQESLNRSMNLVCNRFNIALDELGIFASQKSLLAGHVKIYLPNETLDFSSLNRGNLLPLNIISLIKIETNAKFALIVEKHTIFEKLLSEGFLEKFNPCILLTGKGYGDLAIRRFLNKLDELCHMPIYGIFDCDPFGIEIMCSYKFGSLAMAYLPELAIPCLQWIGLRPSDVISDVKFTKNLSNTEKKKGQSLLTRPYVRKNSNLKHELILMINMNFKADFEDFYIDGNFSFIEYMCEKLKFVNLIN